jgi:hypothetical protein
MNKPTELSKESDTSSIENQNYSTRISSTSLELQEEDSSNVHKPNKGEAVISLEAGEGEQHVPAPEASKGKTLSSEKTSKVENVTTEETNEDRAVDEARWTKAEELLTRWDLGRSDTILQLLFKFLCKLNRCPSWLECIMRTGVDILCIVYLIE